jgi:hypothetical protein
VDFRPRSRTTAGAGVPAGSAHLRASLGREGKTVTPFHRDLPRNYVHLGGRKRWLQSRRALVADMFFGAALEDADFSHRSRGA